MLQGSWSSAVIVTYGANLSFFETRILNQLSQVPVRIVLADRDQLGSTLDEARRNGYHLPQLNRTYVAAPIRHSAAAHVKAILLLGPTDGRLLIGSGNLSYDGLASSGELWSVFSYTDSAPQHVDEFAALRSALQSLAEREMLDRPTLQVLEAVWQSAPWVPLNPKLGTVTTSNIDSSLIEQLRSSVAGPVDELVAFAPFHDSDCAALESLITAFKPKRTRLLVTKSTSANPRSIDRVLSGTSHGSVDEISVRGDEGVYIHAKWVHLVHGDRESLLGGSANLSRAAMLRNAGTGNVEFASITTGGRGAFSHIYDHLNVVPIENILDFGIRYDAPDKAPADDLPDTPQVHSIRIDGSKLILDLDRAIPGDLTFEFIDHKMNKLPTGAHDADGSTYVVTLSSEASARMGAGGYVGVRVSGKDSEWQYVWPYHTSEIIGRLDRASRREYLHRIADIPEQDAELAALVRELDQTLIIDRKSLWQIATPDNSASSADGDAPTMKLGELDWERIYRDRRYAGYFAEGIRPGIAPTEIQIMLAGIAGKLGEIGLTASESNDAVDDLSYEGDPTGSLDPEAADDTLEEVLDRHEVPLSTRTKQAYGRFVKRYVAAIGDSEFVSAVGPIIATTNAIIFTRLVAQLHDKHILDASTAYLAHAAVYSLLWGKTPSGAIADGFDSDTTHAIREMVGAVRFRQEALLVIFGAPLYELNAPAFEAFRSVVRQMVVSDEFKLNVELVCANARSSLVSIQTMDALLKTASPLSSEAIEECLLEPLNIRNVAAEWTRSQVMRDGEPFMADVWVVNAPISELSATQAQDVLAHLLPASYFANRSTDYLRVRFAGNGNSMAYWDARSRHGVALVDGEQQDFSGSSRTRV